MKHPLSIIWYVLMVLLNWNSIHKYRYMCAPACLLHAKLPKSGMICTVACNFGVHIPTSEYTQLVIMHAHITSSLLIYYTINVVHMYNNYSNKICNLSLSVYVTIIVFCIYIYKYVSISLLLNTWKHAVETRVKLHIPVH